MASGILIGVSGFLVHIVMEDIDFGWGMVAGVLMSPLSWISLAMGVTGFFYLQRALYAERVSYVAPTVSALSIVAPVILSVLILGEYVPPFRWLGIWFILLGVVGISRGEWEEGLIASFLRRFRKRPS